MKHFFRISLLLLALMLPGTSAANPITQQQALQNALSFLESRGKSIDNSSLRHAPLRSSMTATESYYVFNIGNNEGYVITSGDDCAPAILGYADSGYIDLDSVPVNMKSWLEEYAQQIRFMQENGSPSSQQPRLSSNQPSISPLLTTTWGQDDPYNQECPDFFGIDKCLTGCVATAMAQVMYYHRSSSVTQTTATIPAYTCRSTWNFDNVAHQISVDSIPAGSVIKWDSMKDSYSGISTPVQKRAVANLMKYCGASVLMDYANRYNGGSGAYSSMVPDALKTYFNYNNGTSLENRNNFMSDEEWNNLIYNELRHSRPVYFSGGNATSGHAFVCDGFDGAGYFHINWGWDGQYDGYFLLNALNPGSSSSGYNLRQEALINAFPKLNSPIPSEIISFEDDSVKAICVQYWDIDDDGELSKAEAALVSTLNDAFEYNQGITSFNELEYFTGLSRIGRCAFLGCVGLTSVTIPNTVTTIGESAFNNCRALANIEIPSSVIEIGRDAFSYTAWFDNQPDGLVYAGRVAYRCKGTMSDGSSIIINDGTLSIASCAFRDCYGLTSVNIPNSITTIGSYAFCNCRSLTSVNIPNSVTLIADGVFRACSSLTSVNIPNSITTIGREAFENCRSLTSVTIPNSVTSIGIGAFRNCYGLTSVNIPNSVSSISGSMFAGCIGLTNVTIPNSVTSIEGYAFENCNSLTSVTLPNSVTSIGYYAFQSCSGLTNLIIGNSVTSIGDYAFLGCSGLTSIVVGSANHKYDSRNNCNAIIKTSSNTLILGCQNTVIPNSVTSIGNYAFALNSSLKSLTIPSSVVYIGSGAFYGCSGLTSIIIPNSVTSIDDRVFYNCSGLASVTIGNSVTSIGNGAFGYCYGLTSVNIPNSVSSISGSMFQGCTGLTSVTIPNSVTSIGDLAFQGCSGLTSVNIPNSVTYIGDGVFYGCSALTRATIPNSVTSIGNYAFGECTGLKNVYSYIADLSIVSSGNWLFRVYGEGDNYDYTGRKLHVLVGTGDAYRANENWYPYFGRVVEDLRPDYSPGDVNSDLEVNIADVNAIINIILGDNSDNTAADVNVDGEVNIADINAVINIILSDT